MLAQLATKQIASAARVRMRPYRLAFDEHFVRFQKRDKNKIITRKTICYVVLSKVFIKYAG